MCEQLLGSMCCESCFMTKPSITSIPIKVISIISAPILLI